MRIATLSSLLAVMFTLSAQAASYPFPFADSGPIPQGGTTLSFEHSISSIPNSITDIQLVLTFSSGWDLGTTIQGSLVLDPSGTGTFASFTPTITSSGTGGQKIYDVTFANFNTLDPNSIWALNLWDTGTSGIQNSLVSWSLTVTAVPEPVNVAMGVFAGLFAIVKLRSWRRQKQA
jgi:hypothetical protein